MSDLIKHECGIALIRLLKPLSYYKQKYGSYSYGLNKLYLIMEKQHNRGQEAAGVACVKLEAKPGDEYIFRERELGSGAITQCFDNINKAIEAEKEILRKELQQETLPANAMELMPYIGEVYLGHLRYSTTGRSGMSYVHPFLRRNNWRSRNLCIAGNFNLTNVDELFKYVVNQGQHPRSNADTFIMLEQLGYLLDDHHSNLYRKYRAEGYSGKELDRVIEDNIDIEEIIAEASKLWDGGFCIIGATGSGESFVFKDRWGIRPCFYYMDDEIVVVASERAVIQTAMNVKYDQVYELGAGEALMIRRDGEVRLSCIAKPGKPSACSFERIYFSRGSDADIYRERKKLGFLLSEQILHEVNYDCDHTVFSFIPNTAEVAYYGMLEGIERYLDGVKMDKLLQMNRRWMEIEDREELKNEISKAGEEYRNIFSHKIRSEKLAIKDIKLRTFIAEGSSRNDLAAHVYDITYNSIVPDEDAIVVIDDSIVRGTTLRQSIVKILSRLSPKKIVIASSSPQIRYPDCYGIDMSRMSEFIAFNAAIALIKERGMKDLLSDVYRKCVASLKGEMELVNYVKEIYAPFSDDEVAKKIAEMVTPPEVSCQVSVVFQTIENLHKACPKSGGDWYFSGEYPTPGGIRVVNRAFVNYFEGNTEMR